MAFEFKDLLSFMNQPVHISNGVIIYSNLKNWSLHETAFRVGQFSFYNEERGICKPTTINTVARLKEFTIEILKREPDLDKKGNVISNSVDVIVSWEGKVFSRFTVSDGWFETVGYSGFEKKLIESLTYVHQVRIEYFVKGIDTLCQKI